MEERKCFGCRGFGYVAYHCRNIGEEKPAQVSLNRFEALKDSNTERGRKWQEDGKR